MIEKLLFDKAFDFVIGNEGGYVNDRYDAGGETKWGISKKQYPNLDLKNLTQEQAKEIYKKDYWSPIYDQLNNPNLAIRVFDMAVNSGVRNAHFILQKAVNACGGSLTLDGDLGKKTLHAANQLHSGFLLERFRVERYNFYKRCVDTSPVRIKFLKGWMGRAYL
jgi:lysozyme family protein